METGYPLPNLNSLSFSLATLRKRPRSGPADQARLLLPNVIGEAKKHQSHSHDW